MIKLLVLVLAAVIGSLAAAGCGNTAGPGSCP
jgi:predicted small secreted protein